LGLLRKGRREAIFVIGEGRTADRRIGFAGLRAGSGGECCSVELEQVVGGGD